MKISKLLVLSALWLLGLSANAQDYTEREAPESPGNTFDEEALAALDKTPQAFQADEYYVLYNKGANMFFIAGNDWETRASFNDKQAAVVYFTQTSAAKEKGEGVYELKNYVPKFGEFRSAFADGPEGVWTDNNSQANRFWKVTSVGEDVRLSCVTQGDNLFLGYNPAKNDTRTYLLESGDIDWQLYSAPGWKEYEAAMVIYNKAKELQSAIDRAAEAGVDDNLIMNACGVYDNLESTIEEMDAQILALMTAMNSLIGEGATADEPVDVTELLVNPDYENGNNDGWSGDTPGFTQSGVSYGNAEFFDKNYTYYQNIKGARAGVYAVKVRGYYRPGSKEEAYQAFLIQNNRNAKLYAKTAAGEVRFPVVNQYAGGADNDLGYEGTVNINEEIYVPNNMQTAAAFFDEDINVNAANYDNTMFFILPEGEMNIGLQKKTQLSTDWTLFDTWKLEYYGNEADAYQMVFEKTKEAYQLPESEYTVSIPYMEAFNSIAPATNDAADIVAALNALEEAYDTLTTNAQLWIDVQKVVEEAKGVAANTDLDQTYTAPLYAWASDFTFAIWDPQYTNAELRAMIAEKKAAIVEAQKHPSPIATNLDMTKMLVNPAFDTNDWTGWTKNAAGGGNVAVSNNCAEAWNNSSFDIYQVVKEAPVGVYKISVQGFYRYGRDDNAYSLYLAQDAQYVKPGGAPTFVYLNEKQTPFKNVFDEPITDESFYKATGDLGTYRSPDDTYFPNGMADAAIAFNAGMFTQEAMGLVREGQDLRIGVKGASNQLGDSWVIFDNFKLTWVGFDVSIIQPVLDEQIAYYEGLQAEPMGKTAYNELAAALSTAKTAVALPAENAMAGKMMFEALSGLFEIDSLVTASINKFKELAAANVKLEEALGTYESTAYENAITSAQTLMSEINDLVGAHTLEDAEVEGYVEKVEEAIAALRVPKVVDPDDNNPADMTVVIDNPNYDETDAGWKGTAATRNADFGNAEIFGQRKYDYYQDLVNLPEGTYELKVQAFFRYGMPTMDYDSLATEFSNNAYLYAAVSPTEDGNYTYFAKPLIRLAAEASEWTADEAPSGYTYCATDTTFTPTGEYVEEVEVIDTLVQYRYVANNMEAASEEFLAEKYMDNSVIVKVPANGRLRIGLMKKGEQGNSWTLFDNWSLTYYGPNSARTATPIDLEKVVSVDNFVAEPSVLMRELFTIDGRRANSMQKGIMIMKTTLSNGNVVVKKIRK
jgi:phage baseplate assembly protein gpV